VHVTDAVSQRTGGGVDSRHDRVGRVLAASDWRADIDWRQLDLRVVLGDHSSEGRSHLLDGRGRPRGMLGG
jgi:hypothetical protein